MTSEAYSADETAMDCKHWTELKCFPKFSCIRTVPINTFSCVVNFFTCISTVNVVVPSSPLRMDLSPLKIVTVVYWVHSWKTYCCYAGNYLASICQYLSDLALDTFVRWSVVGANAFVLAYQLNRFPFLKWNVSIRYWMKLCFWRNEKQNKNKIEICISDPCGLWIFFTNKLNT